MWQLCHTLACSRHNNINEFSEEPVNTFNTKVCSREVLISNNPRHVREQFPYTMRGKLANE